jgi:hypothetical protein
MPENSLDIVPVADQPLRERVPAEPPMSTSLMVMTADYALCPSMCTPYPSQLLC